VKRALGLAEFVPGLPSIVDRGLASPKCGWARSGSRCARARLV